MAVDFLIGGVYHNAFDLDADGIHIWIAALNGSNQPQILKMKADLSQDAVVSYNPAAGSEINLQAGDFSSYWIWASGALGGTNKVVLSESAGVYWVVQDEGDWVGTAHPILVGPGDDSLVTTSTGLSFRQNRYEGATQYWVERTLPNQIWAVARMDDNFDEAYIGAYWYSGINQFVHHSPNSGLNWEDLTDTLPIDCTITTIVAGR